ncbi:hypothetical protein KV557_39265, partial [Kitasatospora aureofaciens]|nr:hypothetical protein [Kitasatospora aureofaciens]
MPERRPAGVLWTTLHRLPTARQPSVTGVVQPGQAEGIDRRHVPRDRVPPRPSTQERQVQRRACPASPTTEPRPISPRPRAAAVPPGARDLP